MTINYGFVYVLSNPSMPNIYKIGMTDRSPSQRMAELNSSTSIPSEFNLILCAEVIDARSIELMLHRELDHARVNQKREFFSLGLGDLQWLEEQLMDLGDDRIFYRSERMDYIEYCHKVDEEKSDLSLKILRFFEQNADPVKWESEKDWMI